MNRQAVLTEACKPLEIQNNPIPEAPPQGLVVKTHYGGMCHTDTDVWQNNISLGGTTKTHWTDIPGVSLPIVMGHEVAGEIYSLGKELDAQSQNLSVGDKVIVFSYPGCRNCAICKQDLTNRCKTGLGHTPGIGRDGGYGAYVSVESSQTVVKVPDGISMEVASLLSCSGLAAYAALCATKHSIQEAMLVHGVASLMVVGTGGLGLWGISLAKAMYPTQVTVIAVDIQEEKLEVARQAGADKTILWDAKESQDEQGLIKKTQDVIGGLFNASVDFVGSGLTTGRLFKCASDAATLVVTGIYGGDCNLPMSQFPFRSLTLKGVSCGSIQLLKDLVQLVHTKKVKPPPITVIDLDHANEYLAKLKAGTMIGRAIIKHI